MKRTAELAGLDSGEETLFTETLAATCRRARLDSKAETPSSSSTITEDEVADLGSEDETSVPDILAEDEIADLDSKADITSSDTAVEKSPANTM